MSSLLCGIKAHCLDWLLFKPLFYYFSYLHFSPATVTSLLLHFFISHPLILPRCILFPQLSWWFSPSPLGCEVSSIHPSQSASPISMQCDFPRAVSTIQHITYFTYFYFKLSALCNIIPKMTGASFCFCTMLYPQCLEQ